MMRPCSTPRCPNLVDAGQSRCPEHQRREQQTRAEDVAFYRTHRWRMTSERFRSKHPWCVECERVGIFRVAEICDHIVSIRDGGSKFDESNLQGLCRYHDQVRRNRQSRKG
jgi:5-methylcytosine-specific restriction protein A